ncbi:DNA/RNA non-specific endonuclease [Cryobacterium suzukii]
MPAGRGAGQAPVSQAPNNGMTSAVDAAPPQGLSQSSAVGDGARPSGIATVSGDGAPSTGTPTNSASDLDERFDALQADLGKRFDQLADDVNADFDKLDADATASVDRAEAVETAPAPDSAADAGEPAGSDAPATASSGPADALPTPRDYPRPTFVHEVAVTGADMPGSRTSFASRTDLLPDTVYHVDGRGDFFTDAQGSVSYVETRYGGTGSLNADLMTPQPNTTYVVHPDVGGAAEGASYAHVFETDDLGRTVLAHTDHLALGDADRSQSVQSRVGNDAGADYDGGHLFANSYGGGGEVTNMAAMLTEINRGRGNTYFNLENTWRGLLNVDPNTKIMVDIRPTYSAGGTVPDMFAVKYSIDGQRAVLARFKNV